MAETYRVYRDGVYIGSSSTKTFSESRPDGTYSYTVSAVDEAGNEGPQTAPEVFTVDTIPPAVPVSLLVSAIDSNVTLTWAGEGDSYRVYRDGLRVGSPPSASFMEIVEDGTYNYRVSALDARGNESTQSTASTVTVDTIPPDVPVAVEVIADGAEVTVTWDASAGAVSYRVYRDSVLVGSPTSTTFEETVRPDGTYTYEISAVDSFSNESEKSAPEPVTINTNLISMPQYLTVKTAGSKVTVDWKAPIERNAGVHTYNVYRNGVMVSHVTRSIHTDTLDDGTYTYAVSAINGFGQESPKTQSVTVTIDTTPAPVPTGVVASADGSSVTATWDPVVGAVSYRVLRNGFQVGNPSVTTFTETRPDGTYNYTVKSIDAYGNLSAASAPSQVIVDTTAPLAPEAPELESAGLSVTVTWNVTDTATKYRVYRDGVLRGSPTDPTYVDSVVEDTYSYTVSAGDDFGNWSEQSEPAEITVDITPTAPPVVSVVNLGREFTLDWAAVPDATAYGIRRNGSDLAITSSLSFFDVVPADGSWYYEVAAKDDYGNWSVYDATDPIEVSTTPPPVPTDVTVAPTALATTISWEPVPEATGYNVARNNTVVASTTETTYTDTVPVQGVYTYTVRARDDAGNYSNFTAPAPVYVDRHTPLTRPTVGLAPLWQETVGRNPDDPDRKFLQYGGG